MAEINGIKVPFVPITPANEVTTQKQKVQPQSTFDTIFQRELEKVKFSGHAVKRLESRNIELSEAELTKLEAAVEKAEQRGSRDSLIMMNETAFIVNVPNKTVVTAVNLKEDSDRVFTNIDSVVIA